MNRTALDSTWICYLRSNGQRSTTRRGARRGHLIFFIKRLSEPTQDARILVEELEADLASSYDAEQRHGLSVERLFAPNIAFFIAYAGDEAVGCGGIAFEDGYGELKRMYVRPKYRGQGVVQALIKQLESEAAARDVKRITLETGDVQHAAIRAYERAGFVRRGAFGEYCSLTPSALERSVFFEKQI
jgi:putative acetyltransferase